MSNRFDYIVVGAGSAGCAVANRLSSNKNKTVLLLEAGKSNHPLTRIPVSFALLIDHPTANWRYRSHADKKTSNRNIPIIILALMHAFFQVKVWVTLLKSK